MSSHTLVIITWGEALAGGCKCFVFYMYFEICANNEAAGQDPTRNL